MEHPANWRLDPVVAYRWLGNSANWRIFRRATARQLRQLPYTPLVRPAASALELAKRFGEAPTLGINYAPLMRDFIGSNFEGAHEYARSQETSGTRPDGSPKSAAERAADDYAGIRSGRLGDIVDKAEELLKANDDHEYRVAVLKLLVDEPFISMEVVIVMAFEYGVDPEKELDLF